MKKIKTSTPIIYTQPVLPPKQNLPFLGTPINLHKKKIIKFIPTDIHHPITDIHPPIIDYDELPIEKISENSSSDEYDIDSDDEFNTLEKKINNNTNIELINNLINNGIDLDEDKTKIKLLINNTEDKEFDEIIKSFL